jgi:phosphatidylinositol alpha 1,6-mannosyltransferase
VVAPASGGPVDLVDDGATGYLISPGEPGELAGAVGRLAASPALRERFGEAARRRVLSRTWSALTDELLGHYAAVTGADAVPARLAA